MIGDRLRCSVISIPEKLEKKMRIMRYFAKLLDKAFKAREKKWKEITTVDTILDPEFEEERSLDILRPAELNRMNFISRIVHLEEGVLFKFREKFIQFNTREHVKYIFELMEAAFSSWTFVLVINTASATRSLYTKAEYKSGFIQEEVERNLKKITDILSRYLT